ncbi:hypothetical protein ABFU27_11130 [Xanthomonas campestris pv. raphani]|uniref:hypothetical protein n=1 Tax=Xanthomonas campestris TaxID=339 RepID=UPI002B229643|nr:hypothetical protein [Xanthomonas campestris]MEA9859112.1 hypothetical protein [Xanthomonas campestris pv. raphani]MEA9940408.1 hypothetical protein [Xanthomonas campestris pv. raphani]
MQFALVLKPGFARDVQRREQLIASVRHMKGVRRLETEMAAKGLLLAELMNPADVTSLEGLDGIATVEGMGVKSAW